MIRSRFILITTLLILTLAGTVNADLVLDLKYSDGSAAKTVNVGDTVFLDLSITNSNVNPSDVIMFNEGLFSAGGRLIAAGTGTFDAATVTDIDGLWSTGGFDANPGTGDAVVDVAKVLANTNFFSGPAVGVGAAVIRIARIALKVNGGSGLTTLTTDLLGPGVDVFSSFDTNTILDPAVTFTSVDLTINGTAVPEPASIILGGLTAAFGGVAALRRRRTAATVKTETAL